MDPATPPFVETAELREVLGNTSLERGRAYAAQGKSVNLAWDSETHVLAATVTGSRGFVYATRVRFNPTPSGLRLVGGRCTCPVRVNCKHVAAAALAANAHFHAGAKDGGYGMHGSPLPWEHQITTALSAGQADDGFQYASSAFEPLALQCELSQEKPTQYAMRFRGARANEAPIRLGVRPATLNDKGNWVSGGVSWDQLRYRYPGQHLNPAQRDWMNVFHSLYAATAGTSLSSRWIFLEDFGSPLLWNLLEQAAGLGIGLVAARKAFTVTLHAPVSLTLDVRATPDAGLHLVPQVTDTQVADTQVADTKVAETHTTGAAGHGSSLADPARMGVLGDPGHGLFWWDAPAGNSAGLATRNLHLAPTSAPVDPALAAWVNARTPVDIPEPARNHFLETYYPQLRQRMPLASSDNSAILPEILDPVLVLTATHLAPVPTAGSPARGRKSAPGTAAAPAPGPGLELLWHWEYQVNGSAVRRPLVDGGDKYRDTAFENGLLAAVAAVLEPFPAAVLEPFPHTISLFPGSNEPVRLRGIDAAMFTTVALPLLAAVDGVRVENDGTAPDYTELTGTPHIGVSTQGTDDGDWFDLGVGITLDGTDIPFAELFLALAAEQEHLMLPNGHYFLLDQPEFHQLRRLIEEARALQEPGGPLRISRYQAGLWAELEELSATAEQASAWRTSVTGLLTLGAVPSVPVPKTLQASLRPYQQEGFDWLVFLQENGLGGVLADDMGLGKTLQTLALISHAKARAEEAAASTTAALPFLVVAPTSVVPNWAAEARRFAPDLRVSTVSDTLRKSGGDVTSLTEGSDVVVLSYTLFRLDNAAYAGRKWAGLILDEAQFVKNPATKASQMARVFPAAFKLAITGTPMENNLMELWSLFAIAAPGLFPSAAHFADYYRKPVEKDGDAQRLAQLRRRIRPLIMRRTKDAVAKDLPAKQEQVLELELAPRHRTIYQRHLQRERQKVLGLIDDMDKNRFVIFKSLTTLRMLSLDASLVDAKYAGIPSSKLDALLEQLEDVVAEGHRALIFSQFTSFLGKAAERLDAEGIEYVYLDGKTRKRGEVIDRFKSGTAPVFLISLKSGGFGLNLTEADYCFLLDPWWNPSTENQAIDRTHRIGQTRNVMVYRLVAKDTIEEKVMALKEKKAKLFTAVLDDDAMFSNALTADDVRGLFEE
ncbi:DEAD/DEAH box helicase [Arthrobacter sp. LAPM80]|uniref:SNF2-related protein n=1 Tax=Arthrobacter sp. LAPM80 TaxID=3141788 RepID=UPI00398B6457